MPIDSERIIGASPNPYVLLDTDFVIVWMNQAYLDVTSRSRESIVGRNMFDAFPSDEKSESHRLLQTSLERVRDTGQADEIALIPYAIEMPDGSISENFWSATHSPVFDHDGKLTHILQHTVNVTEMVELRRVRDEMGMLRRARSVQAQNLDLKVESQRLLSLLDQAPGFTAVIVGPDHRFAIANEAYRKLVGRDDLVGKSVGEALPEVVEQGFGDILDRVYETGEPYLGKREQVVLEPDGKSRELYLNFIFQPMVGESDAVQGIIIQGYDVTEEVRSLDRQSVLVNELNHRVKNTLAIVQALATQSFRGTDPETGQAEFRARLRNLSTAHNLLTEGFWQEAKVEDVVRTTTGVALGQLSERVDAYGEDILLPPQIAVALSMIVYEMCTNALKYGALSNDDGRVKLQWTLDEDRCFRFVWKERGGPPVTEPQARGFGTRLVSRGITDGPKGQVDLSFEPEGVELALRTSLPS